MPTPDAPAILRFGEFELDRGAYELRRRGRPVKLGRQQMDLLILLVEGRRQLVSRDDIVDRLWGKEVFVDVETGINAAISRIRQALGDSRDHPVFVETVPGKGYRFIADVETVAGAAVHEGAGPLQPPSPSETRTTAVRASPDNDSTDAPRSFVPVVPAVEALPTARTRHYFRRGIALAALTMAAGVTALIWQASSAPPALVSLAVIPIENVGNDPEHDYLAAGLTEETSASLAQIDPDRLIVKGRTLDYKGTARTAVEIGRDLDVDYLLDSTIRGEGNRLRITATLIRVRDQQHVWSQTYDREPTSLLGLQQELSTAIAGQIRVRLAAGGTGAADRQTRNAAAYDAYLRGRYFEGRRTPATVAQAIQQYRHAIALDPDYALAWSSLALTYAASAVNSDGRPLTVGPLARDAAAHAVRANPRLAEVQLAVGYINWLLDWDWPAAEAALRSAARLDPSNANAYRVLGHALSQSGQHDEAEAAMRRSRELEPLEPLTYALSAQVAFQARQYPAAVEHARHAVLLDSTFWIGYAELAQAYERTDDANLALEALRDSTRFSGGNSKNIALGGYVLATTGRHSEARAVLRQLEALARERYMPPTAFALVHAGLGERESMFTWLDRAYASRDVHLIFLTADPKWDPFRSDARFVALLAKCGFTAR